MWFFDVKVRDLIVLAGSDVNDTLFGNNDACGWNVNALDTPMKDMTHVPGVSDSMLYYGSWRSMFGFHTEDFDLYSINYNHTGDIIFCRYVDLVHLPSTQLCRCCEVMVCNPTRKETVI